MNRCGSYRKNNVMKRSSIASFTRPAALVGGMIALAAAAQAQPVIHDVYPDGSRLLQFTNTLSFGATSAGPDINANGITVQLTSTSLLGQNLVTNLTSANGLTITGSTSERSVTAPLMTNIMFYTAVIIVTDANGGSATNTVNFDTLKPDFSFEAEDFDHDGGVHLDNPAPGDYAGYDGTEGIDTHAGNLSNGQLTYRNSGLNTEVATGEKPRTVFVDAGWSDYDVGWNDGGNWGNYTRTLPGGVYNVWWRRQCHPFIRDEWSRHHQPNNLKSWHICNSRHW
jgi:hypothetical protein